LVVREQIRSERLLGAGAIRLEYLILAPADRGVGDVAGLPRYDVSWIPDRESVTLDAGRSTA
jgi:hypothetical protein